MAHDFYRITVKPHWRFPEQFALFNEASGAFCGDRLFKGSDDEKGKKWPFKPDEQWKTHITNSSAQMAAKKLQDYLEAREGAKSKKK